MGLLLLAASPELGCVFRGYSSGTRLVGACLVASENYFNYFAGGDGKAAGEIAFVGVELDGLPFSGVRW